ncbi:MAG: tyrosine-type recombinase/integrase [Flavobacteriaceae bacterium]|nr:MAG: tyrosine-type recombinase/integrase [Flavobacteriaceae bacterium]QMU66212.1 MAG: tyrosine-type recombinase/integrase [Flavobacteriaceae bacterium]QMU66537.1 MAG: tyrosine-type recombinase/integrase [Flavobacteriaceae bacterium]
MKKLILQNEPYKIFVKNFKEWLDILGYAESTVYSLPLHLQEFFYYLEQSSIKSINDISTKTVKEYYSYLQERPNQTRNGSLSKSYLNKHQQALKKFREYLKQHNYKDFNIHLKTEENPTEERINILTQLEIKELFKATEYSHNYEHYRLRDKAILVIFYSCGLRRTEAVSLDIKDIFFDKERIHVRKGKNYKERVIPVNRYNLQILEDYVFESRPQFTRTERSRSEEALFISKQGKRMGGMSLSNRLQKIIQASNNKEIVEKKITLHTLRHSIATHLLQQQVKLESIKTFLGHSSLESTQLYTHLLKTIEDDRV